MSASETRWLPCDASDRGQQNPRARALSQPGFVPRRNTGPLSSPGRVPSNSIGPYLIHALPHVLNCLSLRQSHLAGESFHEPAPISTRPLSNSDRDPAGALLHSVPSSHGCSRTLLSARSSAHSSSKRPEHAIAGDRKPSRLFTHCLASAQSRPTHAPPPIGLSFLIGNTIVGPHQLVPSDSNSLRT
jgi:hypothetical protein